MTSAEITKLVERYIGTKDGYLNSFTYGEHERFYAVYCDLDIDVDAYRKKYGTTKKTFVGILKESGPDVQAKIIRGVLAKIPPPQAMEDDPDRIRLYSEFIEIAQRLESGNGVSVTTDFSKKEIVLQALLDAEVLLSQRGAPFAVDRAHTALHGYLKEICRERGLAVTATSSITDLFGLLRKNAGEIKEVVAHDEDAKKLFGSFATALDSLNTIRNRATLAHPNDLLLEAPEAMLFINLSKSVLVYLESKFRLTKS